MRLNPWMSKEWVQVDTETYSFAETDEVWIANSQQTVYMVSRLMTLAVDFDFNIPLHLLNEMTMSVIIFLADQGRKHHTISVYVHCYPR